MEQQIITLRKLIASAGHTLYNGKEFGKEVFLGTADDSENWQEITDAEAAELQKEADIE